MGNNEPLSSDNNEPLSFVNKEQKEKIVHELWNDILTKNNLVSETTPHAYVMGGQPGAGKSTSTTALKTKFNKNIVLIDLDDYRKEHPNYEALYEKHGKESSSYTHQFAGEIKEEIQKRAIDSKYNIIIDGTLGNVERAEKLIENLKNNGYQIDVLIHTCPKDVSWDSVNTRYENALKAGEIPRSVPQEVHDKIVEALPLNADKLCHSKQIESLVVNSREKKLYDSKVDKGLPSVVIKEELNKNVFAKALQAATDKIENRNVPLNQQTGEQRVDKNIER